MIITLEQGIEIVEKLIKDAHKKLQYLGERGVSTNPTLYTLLNPELKLNENKSIKDKTITHLKSLDELNRFIVEILWTGQDFTIFKQEIKKINNLIPRYQNECELNYKERKYILAKDNASHLYKRVKIAIIVIKEISIDVNKGNFRSIIENYHLETLDDFINSKKHGDINNILMDVRKKWLPAIKVRCGQLNILGVSHTQRELCDLEELFIPVNFGDPEVSLEQLQEQLNNKNKFRILINGKTGCGKSSVLKYFALQCADSSFNKNCIPIFISLKRFIESKPIDLVSFIERLFERQEVAPADINKILLNGKALLLLDGLDSHPEALPYVKDFIDSFGLNNFIITCKTDINYLASFQSYTINNLHKEQIKNFISKWFHKKNDLQTGDLLINELFKNSQEDKFELDNYITEFASIPLFLQFLCLAFRQKQHLVNDRILLYQEAMFALLEDEDYENGFDFQDEIYKNMSTAEKLNLLSYLAIKSLETGRNYIPIVELAVYTAEYIHNCVGIENNKNDLLDKAKAVIRSIHIQDGLLVQRPWGDYAFSHSTIQDFFATLYISRNPDKWENWLSIYKKHDEDRWNLIFNQVEQLWQSNLKVLKSLR